MDKSDKVFLVITAVVIAWLFGFLIGGVCDPTEEYRQGQIDSLTGKVKYELRVNPDSTVTWYERGK